MFRIFSLLLVLSIAIPAQSKSNIYIDGGKGLNSSMSGTYNDLAAAIQKKSTASENGIFWLVLAKTRKGDVIAQTIGVKGKTNKLELTAINVAEKYEFPSDFDLIMLRVNCDKKPVAGIKSKKRKI